MPALSFATGKVSADSEYTNPYAITVSAGSQNSTDLVHIAKNDSTAIMFSSNSSGDKNYYESYLINSTSDFDKYFEASQNYDPLTASVVDEKLDNDHNAHKNVLRIYDNDKYQYSSNQSTDTANEYIQQNAAINHASVNNVSGWAEFWFLSESTNGTFMITFGDFAHHRFEWNWGASLGINFGIMPLNPLNGPTSQFFCQPSWTSTPIPIPTTKAKYQANTWYHVRLSFAFNKSWAISINQQEVYNSSNWTINPALKCFDCLTMFTTTQTTASYLPMDAFYIDAIGLSYNMTKQNQLSSTMKFDATYSDYVNITSRNDRNDHILNGSLAIYFLFKIMNYNKTIATKLHIAGYLTQPVSSGKLFLFNQIDLTYDSFDNSYLPYAGTPASRDAEYDFKVSGTFPDINTLVYIDNNTGDFALKIEVQANKYFNFVLNYMAVESSAAFNTSEALIIVLLIVLGIMAVILVKILQRAGGFRMIRKHTRGSVNRGSSGR
ncbi:MAG TPA: hypothetical protein VKM55_21565 [Candidatus Lokiarchaeia archaeon]|nr:hypothetical protein [Candidatus Lokiarchaeia archaeon]